jgi:putative oxygen-independent coproporphyrinogen III oxidase
VASLAEEDFPPTDGLLPPHARRGAQDKDFGVYLHIPFCTVRCGYCDFNTYTQGELPDVSLEDYPKRVFHELDFAAGVLDASGVPSREVQTVFFGGGTPTLLAPARLGDMLRRIESLWGVAPGAEVTVEANPDTITAESVRELAQQGITRVSVGVQSFVPHVLSTLDRTHHPEGVAEVVRAASDAGLQVSLDLLYGTPGESASDWQESLDRALWLNPDHVSAYSLIVEPGTALARRIRRGELQPVDDDTQAQFYEQADAAFHAAGYEWYEVSNWSKGPEGISRHNLNYWLGADWWGVGPGAHSHVGGVRWWNVKHPQAYADRVQAGRSPAQGREVLDEHTRWVESVMLGLRTKRGLAIAFLTDHYPAAGQAVQDALEAGWLEPDAFDAGRVVLTGSGRLLADGLSVRLTGG